MKITQIYSAKPLRIMGVDPGTRCTGWGIVEYNGRGVNEIESGICQPNANLLLPQRLQMIHAQLDKVIQQHSPTYMAIESLFYAKYPQATIKLGHIRGVIILLGAHKDMEICEYSPALVKKTIAGKGSADKNQVARIVQAILKMKQLPRHDATDALAIAITASRSLQMGSKALLAPNKADRKWPPTRSDIGLKSRSVR